MKASVIIPVKNGGLLFEHVLDAVMEQQTPWQFEILVVDSGSEDGALRHCDGRSIKVHRIPSDEFGHGRTRNLAFELTCGEFVCLLTQDALPTSRNWLAKMVAAVEQHEDIAGAFGRQLPYPEADPFTARDLIAHFDKFLTWPYVLRLEDTERYRLDRRYRRILHYFSNSNSCIRRSVWEKYPFPEVDYAEDQHWVRTVIEAGYAKVYCDEAAVYHSHQYSLIESARRAFDEAIALSDGFDFDPCPTLKAAINATIRQTLYDWNCSRSQGKVGDHLFWIARSPFANLARQLGFLLGGRSKQLPEWMVRLISLDRALKDGRWRQARA